MSGHTFKVGDRVRPRGSQRLWIIKAIDGDDDPIAWLRSDGGDYWQSYVSDLSPLPLFEPVERWMILTAAGCPTGSVFMSCPGDELAGAATWVKVVISPAEDQS